MNDVLFTPVPAVCSGMITSVSSKSNTFEVIIYNSPIGEMSGPIYATQIIPPGTDGNLKKGDYVKVMMTFSFGGVERRFQDVYPNSANYILGEFNEQTIIDVEKPESQMSSNDDSRVRLTNKNSGAGIIATSIGDIIMSTGSGVFSSGSAFGSGIYKNMWKTMAQNQHRVLSHNDPLYQSKEHFGLYDGADIEEESTNITDDDYLINFRRYVTQTKSPDKFTSLCEGAWLPFLGANNDQETVTKRKEVLLTRIVNYEDNRLTIEAGNPEDDFLNVRIDKVLVSEKKSPLSNSGTTGIFVNKFKMKVGIDGNIEISSGNGLTGTPKKNFKMTVSSDGDLEIHAAKSITISHGDNDKSNNSITMDSKKGVDIIAKNGLRVNGEPLVNKKFLDWLEKYQTQLCLVTSPGGPAPIHPVALAEFIVRSKKPGEIMSDDKGLPATGIIVDNDQFLSL